MLDQQHRDLGRQRGDGGEQFVTLCFGHAGGRLVEQQHMRPAGEGERDFQKPLLAVGQYRGALVHDVGEAEALDDLDDLVGHRGLLPTSRHQSPPEPRRSETASPMVSSGVRSRNSWLIWKVRAMPSRTR